jgi:hypothetical protein
MGAGGMEAAAGAFGLMGPTAAIGSGAAGKSWNATLVANVHVISQYAEPAGVRVQLFLIRSHLLPRGP